MSTQATKMIESCEIKEKPHNLDKNQIMSYLSLLEKVYDKENCDKFHQERIFRITKALNSIKKYSNFKVSPFRLNKSSTSKEEEKVQNECENTIKEKKDEQKDIEEIMNLIEKELKLNGIDTTDIANDSYISTNVKSENSNSVPNTESKDKTPTPTPTQNPNTQKRLSKLFLKIEMKLKTYLQEEQEEQENDSKAKLASKEEEKCNDNGLNNKSNVENNNKKNMKKRPSQLPELQNSFFSNKKKVEMMLARAKKWKRKSMVEFNALQFSKLKNSNELGVILVKDENNNYQIRNKALPCTALLKKPKKKKNPKNTNDKIVSAFSYAKIDEQDEDMIENEEEINFDKINENPNEEEKINEEKMMNHLPNFIDDKNASSIKITSTINKNKFDVDEMNRESKKEISLYESKPSFYIISDHNICDYSQVDNSSSNSSDDDDDSSDSNDEDEKEKENSASSNSNDSEEKKEGEESKQKSKKSNNSNKSVSSSNQTSNFKYFYRHSIFSPFSNFQDNPERHNEIIEKFSNMNL